MANNKKIILDLCGGTGSWSKPYKDAGYKVYNITLPEYDVDVLEIKNGFLTFYGCLKNGITIDNPYFAKWKPIRIKTSSIYGILAAPPCTEFSKAKSTKPRDFEKGMETVSACLNIIWEIQKRHKLEFWALENPVGLLRRFLGNPPYSFRQWWFGHDRSKHTDIWGRFNEPKRLVFDEPIYLQKTTHNRNCDWFSNSSAEKRAITPAGFAKAFFKANR